MLTYALYYGYDESGSISHVTVAEIVVAITDSNAMELHHKTPQRKGGQHTFDNLQKVTPWEHAEIDEYRYFVP